MSNPRASAETIEDARTMLGNGRKTALLLGTSALSGESLRHAGRIAAATGAQLLAETFPAKLARGAGRVQVQLVPYFLEMAQQFFADYEQLILVGAMPPVSTFAYRNSAMFKAPDTCDVWTLASADFDVPQALADLASALGATEAVPAVGERVVASPPEGQLNSAAIGQSVNALMPEGTILVDEAATAGMEMYGETATAEAHEYLYAIPGAAIGGGLPVALGAAIACPDRKVIALQADGSAMYTNQALWSMAREGCDVTVVILKNDAYAVLNVELARVRSEDATPKMLSMLELDKPCLDWVKIGEGMGVPSVAVDTAEGFHAALEKALGGSGPHLIEATITQNLQPIVDLIHQMSQGS